MGKFRFFSLFGIFLILLPLFSLLGASAAAYTPSSFQVQAKSALLINLDSGDVLFEQNADQPTAPTSIVKLMVAVLTAEAIPDLNTSITVDKSVYHELAGRSYDVFHMEDGEIFTAAQLLNMMILNSSNEAAYLLAHQVSGSVENFIAAMNDKAAALDMQNSHFTNLTGIDDEDAYTTARDLAKLGRYYLTFPELSDIAHTRLYTIGATNLNRQARNIYNTNSLLDGNTAYFYRYATGLKNGSTTAGGRCVVASASYEAENYLCVLMGCPAEDAHGRSVHYEFTDAAQLFHWAFQDFTYKSVVDMNQPMAEAKVRYSFETDHAALYPETDLKATIPVTADLSTITAEVTLTEETVCAPIKSGQVLGTATLYYAGQSLGTVNLIARQEVAANPLLRGLGYLRSLPGRPWFRIAVAAIAVLLLGLYFYRKLRRASANSKRKAARERQRKTPMLDEEESYPFQNERKK